jgi:hypothetical protein
MNTDERLAYAIDFKRGLIRRRIYEALAAPLPDAMRTWARS